MQQEQRLRKRRDFAAAYRTGRIHGNRLLVIRTRPNGGDVTRWGFVVGKAVGKAVTRNRLKRRLREAARTIPAAPGYDVVIGVRPHAAGAPFAELTRSLEELIGRAGLLQMAAQPGPVEERA